MKNLKQYFKEVSVKEYSNALPDLQSAVSIIDDGPDDSDTYEAICHIKRALYILETLYNEKS